MSNTNTVHIYKCPREAVPYIWGTVAGWLQKSIDVAPSWWCLEDLYDYCQQGEMVLWLIMLNGKPCGVALATLEQYRKHLVCGVPWIGGKGMTAWLPKLQEIIEQWAREAGATYLAGTGRRAWTRTANMIEYGVLLVKEI